MFGLGSPTASTFWESGGSCCMKRNPATGTCHRVLWDWWQPKITWGSTKCSGHPVYRHPPRPVARLSEGIDCVVWSFVMGTLPERQKGNWFG